MLGDICLLQQSAEVATISHARMLNRVVKRIKEQEVVVRLSRIDGKVVFLASSDFAWGNASEFRFQKGMSFWAVSEDIMKGSAAA